MYSSFSGLPSVLLALLLVLRFPGENATELPAGQDTRARSGWCQGLPSALTINSLAEVGFSSTNQGWTHTGT